MCRLALMNDHAVDYLGELYLEYLFACLEDAMGGDGMGVSALFRSGRIHVHKGVAVTAKEAAKWIVSKCEKGAAHFTFHTRMMTYGSIRDSNCHPFLHKGMLLNHNGSDSQYGHVDDLTDSEAIARTVALIGHPTSFLQDVSGVFVGFRYGRPFVVKGQSNSSLVLAQEGNAYLFASQLPYEITQLFDTVKHLTTYTWTGKTDEEVEAEKKAALTTRSWNSQDSKTWSYDDWEREEYTSTWGDDYGYTYKDKSARTTRLRELEKELGIVKKPVVVQTYSTVPQARANVTTSWNKNVTDTWNKSGIVPLSTRLDDRTLVWKDITKEDARMYFSNQDYLRGLTTDELADLAHIAWPENEAYEIVAEMTNEEALS